MVLTGADQGDFTIAGGLLKFNARPITRTQQDLDTNNVYRATVTVTDSDDDTATQDVMVKVTNVEETGTITLSAQQPQEEVLLTATLEDPDGAAPPTTTPT